MLDIAHIVTAASVRVGTVGSLPIVSLLPTLTEEMSLTIAQSAAHPGWFRRHYTRCIIYLKMSIYLSIYLNPSSLLFISNHYLSNYNY